MKILVLGTLLKQTASKNIKRENGKLVCESGLSTNVIRMLYKEYERLYDLEKKGFNDLKKYLYNSDGKPFEGLKHRWKYDLTDGDRILYTYGKYLPKIAKREPNSLVLLAYSEHDKQEKIAKSKHFETEEIYKPVADIIDELNTQRMDSDSDIEDMIAYSDLILEAYDSGNHNIYVVSDDIFETCDIQDLEKYLTDEQNECITNYVNYPTPTLILGGGGSGKTLVAIHILKNFNHKDNTHNIYFTQSSELRGSVIKQYENIYYDERKDDTKPEVLDINNFCLNKLGLSRKQFVRFEDFHKFIKSDKNLMEKLSKANINIQDIWAEIRGTIKGSMKSNLTKGLSWQRTTYKNQDDFNSSKDITSLKNISSYIERQKNKKEFTLKYSIEETRKKFKEDENLEDSDKNILEEIIKYFQTFNPNVKELLEDVYLNLSEEESTLEKEHRVLVLEIYKEYAKYCIENNLYDENDLIRMTFKHFEENALPKFDTIIVDEVQDYTELQIYLIYKMAKTAGGLVFAGDSHQMINPTMFSVKRLKELFFNNSLNRNSLNVVFLNKNFRCKNEVITIANNLSDVRRELIGKKEAEEEQYEYSNRQGYHPFRLKYSKENVKKLITELIKYPLTAILVADEFEKLKLIDFYGKANYEKNEVSRIFTVAEIKGMEYKYVVCFNLINRYIDIWNNLMQKFVGKKTSKYRYYFNLIYVALTRSQEYLCFIDENINVELENKLKLSNIEDFNQESLYLTDLTASDEDSLKEAQGYEKLGKYEEALKIYEKYFPDDLDSIYRCEAHIAENNKDYKTAIQYYMLVNDIEAIDVLKEDIKNENISLYKLSEAITNPALITYKKYKKEDLLELINKCFHNKEDANRIKLFVINEVNKYLASLY